MSQTLSRLLSSIPRLSRRRHLEPVERIPGDSPIQLPIAEHQLRSEKVLAVPLAKSMNHSLLERILEWDAAATGLEALDLFPKLRDSPSDSAQRSVVDRVRWFGLKRWNLRERQRGTVSHKVRVSPTQES